MLGLLTTVAAAALTPSGAAPRVLLLLLLLLLDICLTGCCSTAGPLPAVKLPPSHDATSGALLPLPFVAAALLPAAVPLPVLAAGLLLLLTAPLPLL
jgi:hypothetical protein